MSDERDDKPEEISKEIEINLSGEEGFEQALDKGMGAFKSVIEGFVDMAKGMVPPEMLRNWEAAQWLSQVAACIESVESSPSLATKSGELACFSERVETELKGSKFEAQHASFAERLSKVIQIVDAAGGPSLSVEQANQLARAAGYFRAAAASVAPPQDPTQ